MLRNTKVYDIRNLDKDSLVGETYAIDTNVLYWMHYTRGNLTYTGYQTRIYPDFLSNLIENNNKLVTTIYNITELLYIIERNEYDIFKINNINLRKKDYRDNITERIKIKSEFETVIAQIKELYEIKEFKIDILGIDEFINCFDIHKCDDFDYLIIDYLRKNNIKKIVVDDRDYISMDNIEVFTANDKAVSRAKETGILV